MGQGYLMCYIKTLLGGGNPLRPRFDFFQKIKTKKEYFLQAKKLRKSEHRNKNKNIRFSENEINQINNLIELHGIKFSSYARGKILDLKIGTNIEIEQIYQLKKIGNNLNQMAKKINMDKTIKNNIELLEKLVSIENEIKKLSDDS